MREEEKLTISVLVVHLELSLAKIIEEIEDVVEKWKKFIKLSESMIQDEGDELAK